MMNDIIQKILNNFKNISKLQKKQKSEKKDEISDVFENVNINNDYDKQ